MQFKKNVMFVKSFPDNYQKVIEGLVDCTVRETPTDFIEERDFLFFIQRFEKNKYRKKYYIELKNTKTGSTILKRISNITQRVIQYHWFFGVKVKEIYIISFTQVFPEKVVSKKKVWHKQNKSKKLLKGSKWVSKK